MQWSPVENWSVQDFLVTERADTFDTLQSMEIFVISSSF